MKINCETYYLYCAVDHEGEALESCGAKCRDRAATLNFLKKPSKSYGNSHAIVTDRLRSICAAMKVIGKAVNRPLAQQTSRELTSAVSTTGKGNAAVSANAMFAEFHCRSSIDNHFKRDDIYSREKILNSSNALLLLSGTCLVPGKFTYSFAN